MSRHSRAESMVDLMESVPLVVLSQVIFVVLWHHGISQHRQGQLKVKDKICLGNSQPQDSSMSPPPLCNVASYKIQWFHEGKRMRWLGPLQPLEILHKTQCHLKKTQKQQDSWNKLSVTGNLFAIAICDGSAQHVGIVTWHGWDHTDKNSPSLGQRAHWAVGEGVTGVQHQRQYMMLSVGDHHFDPNNYPNNYNNKNNNSRQCGILQRDILTMKKDQGYPMIKMPGKFCAHGSSSNISSSLSLHTAQGPEDVQTVPENTLFDDDGDPADVVLALDDTAGQTGDVHSPMVGNMMVLEQVTGDHNTVATVTDGCRAAGIMVVDGRSVGSGMTSLQPADSAVKCCHKEEDFSMTLQQQLYCQEEHICGLKNKLHKRMCLMKWEWFCRAERLGWLCCMQSLKKSIQNYKNNFGLSSDWSHSRTMHNLKHIKGGSSLKSKPKWRKYLEAHMQEEVTRLRELIQAEKEREMANLEQQYYCMRNWPPHPSWSAQFSQSNAPSLKVLGVVIDTQDDIGIGMPSAARQMNSDEEHEPNDDDGSTVPVSAMMEAVTKGVEVALCNILAKGQTITSQCGRCNCCHRAHEDEEVEVHCLFKERLGITQDIDFITHQLATAEDIHAYKYEDGPGPDQNKLAFDLAQNYSSPWNTFILKLLCQEFQACCALETPVETEACLVKERMQMGKESRQANHHQNISLILILDQMVKLKSEVQDDDIQSWKWLQHLIKTLGEHGMSSEESSVENGVENILRVKNMPWRRNIDQELEIRDFQCILDTDVFSPQGSKPLTHKCAPDNPSTTCSAAKALPLALYNGAWIAHLTKCEIEALDVPQQTFPWMKVVIT
ncbi:hypothetical protein BKA82DRAFT_4016137 [Pisolithus tinctorius]|nr:hypothetical protein BKA82DRAFT_4016137 [Pisolithus tinctorius]